MATSFAPYAAYNARVRFNIHGVGAAVVARRWTVNVKTVDVDATNFEGGGYAEQVTGVVGADVSVEFLYDPNTPGNAFALHSLLPSMNVLSYNYLGVRLYPNFTDNPNSFFTFPYLTLTGVSVDVDVHGAVVMTVSGKSDSNFTYPI